MNCEECEDFELYHDCDDQDVLPENRKIKIKDNCGRWLCSGSCKNEVLTTASTKE